MSFWRSIGVVVALVLVAGSFFAGYFKGNRDALDQDWRRLLHDNLGDLAKVDSGKIELFRSKKRQFIIAGYEWFSKPHSWAEYLRSRTDYPSPRTVELDMQHAKQVAESAPGPTAASGRPRQQRGQSRRTGDRWRNLAFSGTDPSAGVPGALLVMAHPYR